MKHIDFRDQIARNKRNSFFLMSLIFAVFVLLGFVIGNIYEGYFFVIMVFAIIISVTYIWIGYYNSDKIAVASVGARQASREKYKQYYDLVEGLTLASGLPMPKLYVMKSAQINAFASGRDYRHAVVCVTDGALEKLEKREFEGVLAHELGHVANYDIRYMTLATVMVGMIAIVSEIFLRSLWFSSGNRNERNGAFIIIGVALAILAPIAVYFVQLAISRRREFGADATAVQFTRYPDGLIRALKKIKEEHAPSEKKVSKAVAPLFFVNPLKGMSSTHPSVEKRIEALGRM